MPIPCTPGATPVEWSVLYTLSSQLDTLATTLNTPSYVSLDEHPDAPFKFEDPVPLPACGIYFQLQPGTLNVEAQYLATSHMSSAPLADPDPVLKAMAEREDLYLVTDPDDCWCKTIFKVVVDNDRLRLEEVPSSTTGCCQSLNMPQPGDALDYSQHVIPAAWAEYWAIVGYPGSSAQPPWVEKDKCRLTANGIGFQFQDETTGAPLVGAARKITGKWVWPIRARYMELLWEKLMFILACRRHGGAKAEEIIDSISGETITYVPTGCNPTPADILRTLVHESEIADDLPGCLTDGIADWASTTIKFPWDESTCGAEICEESGGLLFYCETVRHLEKLIEAAAARITPYTNEASNACCCTPDIGWRNKSGTSRYCPVYDTTDEIWIYSSSVDYECEDAENPGTTCNWTGTSATVEGYTAGATACPFTNTGTPCALYCQDGTGLPTGQTLLAAAAPDWEYLSQLAATDASTEGWGGAGGIPAQGTTTFLTSPPPGAPGWGWGATAETFLGQWRVELPVGYYASQDCAPVIFDVVCNVYLYVDEAVVDTTQVTVTLTWNTAEGRVTSDWQNVDNIVLQAADSSFRYEILFDEISPPKCPAPLC